MQKCALLVGVRLSVDRRHLDFDLTRLDAATDVLLMATGFQEGLRSRLRAQATVTSYLDWEEEEDGDGGGGTDGGGDGGDGCSERGAFAKADGGRAPAAAIAVVGHFAREATPTTPAGRDGAMRAWARAFEPFDWTVQDARGADDPTRLREMQRRFGRFCIAPKALDAEGASR